MSVEWVTCGKDDHWCSFQNVNLTNVDAFGVYVIWVDLGDKGYRAVRVGQGDIADRIKAHRRDTEITDYESEGPMYLTWASINATLVDGAEAFLGDHYDPLVGSQFPDVPHVILNLPW